METISDGQFLYNIEESLMKSGQPPMKIEILCSWVQVEEVNVHSHGLPDIPSFGTPHVGRLPKTKISPVSLRECNQDRQVDNTSVKGPSNSQKVSM